MKVDTSGRKFKIEFPTALYIQLHILEPPLEIIVFRVPLKYNFGLSHPERRINLCKICISSIFCSYPKFQNNTFLQFSKFYYIK